MRILMQVAFFYRLGGLKDFGGQHIVFMSEDQSSPTEWKRGTMEKLLSINAQWGGRGGHDSITEPKGIE